MLVTHKVSDCAGNRRDCIRAPFNEAACQSGLSAERPNHMGMKNKPNRPARSAPCKGNAEHRDYVITARMDMNDVYVFVADDPGKTQSRTEIPAVANTERRCRQAAFPAPSFDKATGAAGELHKRSASAQSFRHLDGMGLNPTLTFCTRDIKQPQTRTICTTGDPRTTFA